ncbi:imidazole glycerol phosphate synthase subunit HisH [Clostridium magnum]|uniref:Imidazole glycerol phosphate synthase subunit HisH n=1 Tax=Clostridium magnum DSM 2767 TaxID=1121326 RepID=A0A161X439_9CLOT|nr:imidazole glycerol phosphate synthase subunit HisH [Clostridium magnum]KZL94288.1 imidazole glycerol phosphate synthase subunit HisH 1 [Clostridium magnum DSM 2767]SHH90928.1 glutamine amidotransferase [Clostridium magnum DSM 2767]
MISIIDYGMGNLRSVQKALESIGEEAIITSDKEQIEKSDGVILPGVGAFPDAMENLKSKGLDETLKHVVAQKKPVLGICLGMQLLFTEGEEVKQCEGLGLIQGKIKKLYGNVKIPHMGWNSLKIDKKCALLEGIDEGSYVYFVHSFYAEMENKEDISATTFYEIDVPAIVSDGNLFGAQFHPEKSGDVGIQMLKNFAKLTRG